MHNRHGIKAIAGMATRGKERVDGRRFSRLWDLPAALHDPRLLNEIGRPKGPMDACEDKAEGTLPVGLVFFGQFIDHDITLDTSSHLPSTLNEHTKVREVENFRTPTLDLDCLYGQGPEAHPYLYHQREDAGAMPGATLIVDGHDLQRNIEGTAIIGDPRNDENAVVSQLQYGFIRFHNAVVTRLSAQTGLSGTALWENARAVVLSHYHWIVAMEFLPAIIGQQTWREIHSDGRVLFQPERHGAASIPIEFSAAAYRFGHSMIPGTIDYNSTPEYQQIALFDSRLGRAFGGRPVAIDWTSFVGNRAQRARRLDTTLASTLLDLPFAADERSLARRNLLRGLGFRLPSGQAVRDKLCQALGREIPKTRVRLTDSEREHLAGLHLDCTSFEESTPLWFYILAEAQEQARGNHLGPVGGRIVGEVLLGLMENDTRSFLNHTPEWYPGGSMDDLKLVEDGQTFDLERLLAIGKSWSPARA